MSHIKISFKSFSGASPPGKITEGVRWRSGRSFRPRIPVSIASTAAAMR